MFGIVIVRLLMFGLGFLLVIGILVRFLIVNILENCLFKSFDFVFLLFIILLLILKLVMFGLLFFSCLIYD